MVLYMVKLASDAYILDLTREIFHFQFGSFLWENSGTLKHTAIIMWMLKTHFLNSNLSFHFLLFISGFPSAQQMYHFGGAFDANS